MRRLLAGILIVLSAVMLLASAAGIGAIWYYKAPLTHTVTSQLKEIDAALAQAEVSLDSSEKQLQRALQIVDSAQTAFESMKTQTNSAENLFETVQSTLNDRLLPELRTTRSRIDQARSTLESLQSVLKRVQSLMPGADLTLPDQTLTDLIASARSLDTEIANMQILADQASAFLGANADLLGGDLTETRSSLVNFLDAIGDYKGKIAGWREQAQGLLAGAPRWIGQASVILTIFLIWFGFSQFSLLLHGLGVWRGGNPLRALRRRAQAGEATADEASFDVEGQA